MVAGLAERPQDWRAIGMWRNLGAEIVEWERGRVMLAAELTADSHGFPTASGPIVHGGALSALADCAVASAAASVAEPGEIPTTSSLQLDYYRPARPGRLLARATARHRTSRLAYCHTTVEQGDGTVVAEGRAVMYYVRAEAAAPPAS